jgi:hypothetical protein
MCRTCSTNEQQIVRNRNTDGFCTCSAGREQRVASSRQVQCRAMQSVCARANKNKVDTSQIAAHSDPAKIAKYRYREDASYTIVPLSIETYGRPAHGPHPTHWLRSSRV